MEKTKHIHVGTSKKYFAQRIRLAGQACALMENYHLSNIFCMEGGLDDWKQAGFSTAKGKSTIDMM